MFNYLGQGHEGHQSGGNVCKVCSLFRLFQTLLMWIDIHRNVDVFLRNTGGMANILF